MKSNTLKILSLCLLLALVLGACMPGLAEDDKPALITGGGILWVGMGRCPVVAVNLPANAKSFSVTSSKPSVLKVGKQKGFGPYGWWMEPLKVGKSKITLKYKTGGKTRSVSAIFQVRNYPDPFEYIKINGKKVDLKKRQSNLFLEGYSKNSITINYKLKSGWKVDRLLGNRIKGDEWEECTWRRNKALSLKSYDAADLSIDLSNTSTGAICSFEIIVTR
jgi:hypothetical protein